MAKNGTSKRNQPESPDPKYSMSWSPHPFRHRVVKNNPNLIRTDIFGLDA